MKKNEQSLIDPWENISGLKYVWLASLKERKERMGPETVLEEIMVEQVCDYTKTHWIVHFERVNFMVYELYLNEAVIKMTEAILLF